MNRFAAALALIATSFLSGCGSEAPYGPPDKRSPEQIAEEAKQLDAEHAEIKKVHDQLDAKKKK